MNEAEEKCYLRGQQAVWTSLLRQALVELSSTKTPALDAARLLQERAEVVAILRQICDEHGDNDWSDDLHLVDVLDKHLWRHLVATSDKR